MVSSERTAEQGFTLLEVAVAISILGIVAVSVVASVATSVRIENADRGRSEAQVAARSQMEMIYAWPDYTTLASTFNGGRFLTGSLVSSETPALPPGTVTVDSTNPDLLWVIVRVEWVDPSGDQELELSTLISNPAFTVEM